jgi:hypothetical protein
MPAPPLPDGFTLDTPDDNAWSAKLPQPIKRGNLDPWNRAVLKNPDGSVSTTSSFSIGTDNGETLIPSVVNGVRLSKQNPDGSIDYSDAIRSSRLGQWTRAKRPRSRRR